MQPKFIKIELQWSKISKEIFKNWDYFNEIKIWKPNSRHVNSHKGKSKCIGTRIACTMVMLTMQKWGSRCKGDRKWVLDMVFKPFDLCSTFDGSLKYITIASNRIFRHKNLVSPSLFPLYSTTKLRSFSSEGHKSQWDSQSNSRRYSQTVHSLQCGYLTMYS